MTQKSRTHISVLFTCALALALILITGSAFGQDANSGWTEWETVNFNYAWTKLPDGNYDYCYSNNSQECIERGLNRIHNLCENKGAPAEGVLVAYSDYILNPWDRYTLGIVNWNTGWEADTPVSLLSLRFNYNDPSTNRPSTEHWLNCHAILNLSELAIRTGEVQTLVMGVPNVPKRVTDDVKTTVGAIQYIFYADSSDGRISGELQRRFKTK